MFIDLGKKYVYNKMILWLWVIFLLFLLWMVQREGFSVLPTSYSTSIVSKYTDFEKGRNVTDDTIKTNLDLYQKLGVPEASINTYITTGKWPYTDDFIAAATKSNIMSSITMSEPIWPQEQAVQMFARIFGNAELSELKSSKLMCKVDASGNSIGDGMYTMDASNNPVSLVKNEDLPTTVKGFQFIRQPCNPCNILNNVYDCPFAVPDAEKQSLLPPAMLQYIWS
jgi:hypothetical protein